MIPSPFLQELEAKTLQLQAVQEENRQVEKQLAALRTERAAMSVSLTLEEAQGQAEQVAEEVWKGLLSRG